MTDRRERSIIFSIYLFSLLVPGCTAVSQRLDASASQGKGWDFGQWLRKNTLSNIKVCERDSKMDKLDTHWNHLEHYFWVGANSWLQSSNTPP